MEMHDYDLIVIDSAPEPSLIDYGIYSIPAIEYFRDSVFNYSAFAEAYEAAALDGLNKL